MSGLLLWVVWRLCVGGKFLDGRGGVKCDEMGMRGVESEMEEIMICASNITENDELFVEVIHTFAVSALRPPYMAPIPHQRIIHIPPTVDLLKTLPI